VNKLLLVDDEDGIRTVLSLLLADMGFAVTTAARGDEALAIYQEQRPAIVLSDIKMPGMDGIELLKRVKALNPDTEVLLLTGHGDMELAVAGLRHGAGDFLNKPVSDAALEVALDRARERMAMRQALRRHTEHLEELVAQRTAELLRSERFAAVGESAAVLAHAIKNIAGALEGTMYVLEKGLELDKREYFEQGWRMVRADVDRLRKLALGLLDLGKPPLLEYSPTRPAAPAEAVLNGLERRAAECGVTLRLLDEAGDEPWLMAPEAVRDCLLNLALNAIDALAGEDGVLENLEGDSNGMRGSAPRPARGMMPLDPHLGMAVVNGKLPEDAQGHAAKQNHAATGEPLVLIRISREGPELVYRVRDNGPGLNHTQDAPQTHFQSSKTQGAGIGLFATRRTAREMNAEFGFTAEYVGGAEAYLRLRQGE
jgi:FixJ family two-component response regulator